MKHFIVEHVVSLLAVMMVAAVLWCLILGAVMYVFGCSMSLEVESQMHHHENDSAMTAEPTPTPAARIN